MSQPAHLIVGLGNPGPEYVGNRHNIGFMALDALAARAKAEMWRRKFKGEIASLALADQPCALLKPMTFMNLSGESVGEAMRFYKLNPADVIVIHDDMDLLPGKVKVKQGGGAAGHNGLKSIDAHIGPDYWRVRLGVGHPENRAVVTDYVLSNFAKADQVWLGPLLEALADNFLLLLDAKQALFMQKFC
jgi:PTH1 family peptidyl-tRNA hydrolase